MEGNSLTDVSAVGSLRNLEVLSAYRNELTGSIPDFARLTKLRELWLANNRLSGTIPAKLGDLTDLTTLSLNGNQLTGCIPSSLASHAATINPQREGRNLCIEGASGVAPASSAYAVANAEPRHGDPTSDGGHGVPTAAALAHGDRVGRAGVSLNPLPGLAGHAHGPLGSFHPMRSSSWATAFRGFSIAPMLLRPVREQRLQASGPSVVLDMRRIFSPDLHDGFGIRRYVSTSQATALARATTVGDLLILTPNQRGLQGETTVTVTAIERGLGTSVRLRVIVQSTLPLTPRRPGT